MGVSPRRVQISGRTPQVCSPCRRNFFGAEGEDILYGGGGNDDLHGGLGNDILDGGEDSDKFFFDTAIGPTSVDKIRDFEVVVDYIELSKATPPGRISPTERYQRGEFFNGEKAHDSETTHHLQRKEGAGISSTTTARGK